MSGAATKASERHPSRGAQGPFPVAPGRLPLLGHVPWLYRELPAFIARSAQRCGPLFWIDIGKGDLQLFTMGDTDALTRAVRGTSNAHRADQIGGLLRGSLMVLDGDDHRRRKQPLMPPFQPPGLDRARVGALAAEVFARHLDRALDEGACRVLDLCRGMALEVIFRILGVEPAAMASWKRSFTEAALLLLNLPDVPLSPTRRGRAALQSLEERTVAIVEAERKKPETGTILSAMCHARDEQGAPLPAAVLAGELRALVLAGHETTATAMAWMLHRLAASPSLWARLVEEAGDPPLDGEALGRARFESALFRETLRLHPPIAVNSRLLLEDTEVASHTVPAGTVVVYSLYHASRDPSRHEAPDDFRVDRWLREGRAPTAADALQFGTGPRFCLGYHLAMHEGALFASLLARRAARKGLSPRPTPVPAGSFWPLHTPDGARVVRWERAGSKEH